MGPLYHTAAATAIIALVANVVFAGDWVLPAKAAFTRRQRLRWDCLLGGFAVDRGAVGSAGAVGGGGGGGGR